MKGGNLRLLLLALVAGVIIGLVAWAATTCGSTARAPEEGEARPSFSLLGPLTSDQMNGPALGAFNASFFVLDVEKKALYALRQESSIEQILPAEWLTDRSLRVVSDHAAYSVDVPSGAIRRIGNETASQDELDRPSDVSRSGLWTTLGGINPGPTSMVDGPLPVLVSRTGSPPLFRLTSASVSRYPGWPAWSPNDDTLAFIGNYCAPQPGSDLFLFRPAEASLRNLTAGMGRAIVGLVWRPDGGAIAFGSFDSRIGQTPNESVDIVSTSTGTVMQLVQTTEGGMVLMPRSWTADGRYLLLGQFAGGFCESAKPPPPPTTLENPAPMMRP